MTAHRSSPSLYFLLASVLSGVPSWGCGSSSSPITTADSGTMHDAAGDAGHDAAGCVASPVSGASCNPDVPACSTGPCPSWFCSGGTWVQDQGCARPPEDAGTAPLDSGATSVTSCDECSAGRMCIVSITQGGACLQAEDGGKADGGCPNGATGACCNTFTTYSCASLPAACAGKVTCACAGQSCAGGPSCVNGDVDAGTSGLVLVCEENGA